METEETTSSPHILIISGSFYEDISYQLERGAAAVLTEAGATYDQMDVPGALEIPVALSLAVKAGLIPNSKKKGRYDGAIALGCIIRGETYHFEIVANEASRGLMNLAIDHHIPIGNGILTVESREQALSRLQKGKNHKGEDAANACLSLIKANIAFQKARQPEE